MYHKSKVEHHIICPISFINSLRTGTTVILNESTEENRVEALITMTYEDLSERIRFAAAILVSSQLTKQIGYVRSQYNEVNRNRMFSIRFNASDYLNMKLQNINASESSIKTSFTNNRIESLHTFIKSLSIDKRTRRRTLQGKSLKTIFK